MGVNMGVNVGIIYTKNKYKNFSLQSLKLL